MSEPAETTAPSPPPLQLHEPKLFPPIAPEQAAKNLRFATRLWCAFAFVLCVAMLGVGFWLRPDPSGTGTHAQLGLQKCGMMQQFNTPCPTCGCTTSVSYFVHGNLIASLFNQPFGFAVALFAAILVPLAGWGMVTGQWRGPSMFWLGWHWRWWTFGLVAILLGSWIYKIILVRNDIHFPW